ncbi:UNVERIFIED_CONTAM: hypothetical protein HDU68_009256 [Siphonaria sp. JEL0065]|nr:hypothetical protein HDU68_009256 [Siphonaria sp. JEL0065]
MHKFQQLLAANGGKSVLKKQKSNAAAVRKLRGRSSEVATAIQQHQQQQAQNQQPQQHPVQISSVAAAATATSFMQHQFTDTYPPQQQQPEYQQIKVEQQQQQQKLPQLQQSASILDQHITPHDPESSIHYSPRPALHQNGCSSGSCATRIEAPEYIPQDPLELLAMVSSSVAVASLAPIVKQEQPEFLPSQPQLSVPMAPSLTLGYHSQYHSGEQHHFWQQQQQQAHFGGPSAAHSNGQSLLQVSVGMVEAGGSSLAGKLQE